MFRLRFPFPLRRTRTHLVVTVAALSVIIGAGVSSYSDHVRRIHRTHARAALLATAQWMERTATAQGRYPVASMIPGELLLVEGGGYTILTQSRDGMSYTLTAMPNAAQSSDECGAYSLNQAGLRAQVATFAVPKPLDSADCWRP